MKRVSITIALLLVTGCTLPGYQGGPGPRSTQYTYPGRAWNPDSGMAHSPVATVAEPEDGGVFIFSMVLTDGSTYVYDAEKYESRAVCEEGRNAYVATMAARSRDGRLPMMTTKCFRAHERPTLQAR